MFKTYFAFRSKNHISFLPGWNSRDVLTSPCIHYISALSYAGEHLSSVTIHLRCAFAFPRDNCSIVNISSLSEIYPRSKIHVNTQKIYLRNSSITQFCCYLKLSGIWVFLAEKICVFKKKVQIGKKKWNQNKFMNNEDSVFVYFLKRTPF